MNISAEAYSDALSCPICMETLTTPKILSCGHSFCLTPCLAEIVKQQDPMCPLCRIAIVLPPSGKIEDLATNFSVKGLLEILEKTEDQETTSPTISSHAKEDRDYVCMTCLEQVCSCCQLSFHVDNNHDCISVLEFTEKRQQDVSKMITMINGLSWSEGCERYAMASLVINTYLNLKENVSTACNEILQSLSEKKLNLRKIKELQKQVKKDYSKLKAAWETLKREIREAKKQADVKTQLAGYRQKLMGLKLPDSVHKKPSFRLKISSFENLKGKTEALSESLTQQLKTGSFDILAMEEKLHDISENIGVIEQYIKDVTQDYKKFLLQEIGITNHTVELHHLFQVMEAIDVMNFKSDRLSGDIMHNCNKSFGLFTTSKYIIRTSCQNLLKEFRDGFLPLVTAEERIVEILEEMERCKGYYEDIYEVIGRNFDIYDKSYTQRCVKIYLLSQDTSFVLPSTSKSRAEFMKNYLTEFESLKQTTKIQCKALLRYLSEKDFNADVAHEELKAIEMRLEKTEYHFELLKRLSSMEVRCHEITEEFRRFLLPEKILTAKFRRCYEHKEEVQRLWKLILQHQPTTILCDVNIINMFTKTMEEKRTKVFSLLRLSNSELNDLVSRMSNLTQIMEMRTRLHSTVRDISHSLSDFYHRHRQELNALNLVSEISYADPTTMTSFIRKYSLQNLQLLANQAEALSKLFYEIRSTFAAECNSVYQKALLMRCQLMKRASGWLTQFVPESKRKDWNIPDLTQENNDQWKTVADIVKADDFDIRVLESGLDRALSLYNEVNDISAKMFVDCLKGVPWLIFLIALCTILFFGYIVWKEF